MAAKGKTRKLYRSAITGRFMPKGYVKRHPKTTVTQTVKVPKKK